jgi:polyisoprenoid-binding protein YceI
VFSHLRSPDFFDVERFPTMTFAVTPVAKDSDDYRVVGDLTIREITQEVAPDRRGERSGHRPVRQRTHRCERDGQAEPSRLRADLNVVTEAGLLLVGDDVKISAEAEFVLAQCPAEEDPKDPRLEMAVSA